MSIFETSEDEARDLHPRFRLIYGILFVTFVVLFLRLWYLQILRGAELREYSEKNRVKENKIRAPRGLMLDRENRILVDNTVGFEVTISPQYASNLEDTSQEVGKILSINPKIISDKVMQSKKNGSFMPVSIKENLSFEEVFRLKKIRIDNPGLNVDETVLRYYPFEDNGAQLFGYVSEISKAQLDNYTKKNAGKILLQQGDYVGQSGLEDVWDFDLRGRDGLNFIEVDAHGRETSTKNKVLSELRPQLEVAGKNLVLTLDKDIQVAAYKAMTEQKDRIGPRTGGLLVMKTNGEILAWVNTPSFNPNKFARGITKEIWAQLINDPFNPLRNKIIQDHFSPGSTLKPIVALAALQEGIVTSTTIVSAPGKMRFGNRFYHDSLRNGHGDINILRAIESSSNVFFYKMGIQLGIDTLAKYAKLVGLGSRTNIELSHEAAGLFPTKDWKLKTIGEPWQPGENLSNAIGQGYVLTTLLQMTLAYNTIATEGKLFKPILVKKITDEHMNIIKEFSPQPARDITIPDENGAFVDKKNILIVREALRRVANGERGTARWWKIPGVEIAGKTGTSQIMSFSADDIYSSCEKRPLTQRHHGAFIAFAPANNPEIIVGALTEHSCHGNVGSAPVVRDVIRAYFEKNHPELLKDKKSIKVETLPDAAAIEEINE
ncbi:MAG: penicillin-binding protein 2 [Bdellovibrionales bacterium RBG_16_40_8]|nr:MAG: penicillin-binding protein 2 [Bdellovibrionales bacterium RBG_16_40_8]